VADRKPGWLSRRFNTRAARSYQRVYDRDLLAQRLADDGRYAELAETLGDLVREYAKQTKITDHTRSSVISWIRRCDALVRAGLRDQAETEAVTLSRIITQYEGPNGELAGVLRQTMTSAIRGTRAIGA